MMRRSRTAQGLFVRTLEPEDAHHLAALFGQLSADSRYLRYFSPMPSLPHRLLTYLASVDHVRHEAVGAFLGGELIGAAHSFRLREDPTRADISVEVADRHQRTGVGGRLLDALAERAIHDGITRFTALTLSENHGVLTLLRHSPYPVELHLEGAETAIELLLVPGPLAASA